MFVKSLVCLSLLALGSATAAETTPATPEGQVQTKCTHNTAAEEPVPADYRLCAEWPSGKEVISLCLYAIDAEEGPATSILRLRCDATGQLLRRGEARPELGTQGLITPMEDPRMVKIPAEMGLGDNMFILTDQWFRDWTTYAVVQYDSGEDGDNCFADIYNEGDEQEAGAIPAARLFLGNAASPKN